MADFDYAYTYTQEYKDFVRDLNERFAKQYVSWKDAWNLKHSYRTNYGSGNIEEFKSRRYAYYRYIETELVKEANPKKREILEYHLAFELLSRGFSSLTRENPKVLEEYISAVKTGNTAKRAEILERLAQVWFDVKMYNHAAEEYLELGNIPKVVEMWELKTSTEDAISDDFEMLAYAYRETGMSKIEACKRVAQKCRIYLAERYSGRTNHNFDVILSDLYYNAEEWRLWAEVEKRLAHRDDDGFSKEDLEIDSVVAEHEGNYAEAARLYEAYLKQEGRGFVNLEQFKKLESLYRRLGDKLSAEGNSGGAKRAYLNAANTVFRSGHYDRGAREYHQLTGNPNTNIGNVYDIAAKNYANTESNIVDNIYFQIWHEINNNLSGMHTQSYEGRDLEKRDKLQYEFAVKLLTYWNALQDMYGLDRINLDLDAEFNLDHKEEYERLGNEFRQQMITKLSVKSATEFLNSPVFLRYLFHGMLVPRYIEERDLMNAIKKIYSYLGRRPVLPRRWTPLLRELYKSEIKEEYHRLGYVHPKIREARMLREIGNYKKASQIYKDQGFPKMAKRVTQMHKLPK